MPYPEAPRMPEHTNSLVRPLQQIRPYNLAPHTVNTDKASFLFVAETRDEYAAQGEMLKVAAAQDDPSTQLVERVLLALVKNQQEDAERVARETKTADVALLERVLGGLRKLDVSGPSAMDLARGVAAPEAAVTPEPAKPEENVVVPPHVAFINRVVHGIGQPAPQAQEMPEPAPEPAKPVYLPVPFTSRETLVSDIMAKREQRTGFSEDVIAARSDFSNIKHPEGFDPLSQHEHYASVLNNDPDTVLFMGKGDWRAYLTPAARKRLYENPDTSEFFGALPYYNPVRHNLRAPLSQTNTNPLTDPFPRHKQRESTSLYEQIAVERGRDPLTGEEIIDPLTTDFTVVDEAYATAPRHTYEATPGNDDQHAPESSGSPASDMVVRLLSQPGGKQEDGDVVDITPVRSSEIAIERRATASQVGSLALDNKGQSSTETLHVVADNNSGSSKVVPDGRVFTKSDVTGDTSTSAAYLTPVQAPVIPDIKPGGDVDDRPYAVTDYPQDRHVWVSPAASAEGSPDPSPAIAKPVAELTASPAAEPKRRSLARFVIQAFTHRTNRNQETNPAPAPEKEAPSVTDTIINLGVIGARAALKAWQNRRNR